MGKSRKIACYTLTHLPSGKFYVGSTGDYIGRKADHLWRLRNNKHRNKLLQELFNEDSNEDNYKWSVILTNTRKEAHELEQGFFDTNATNPLMLNGALHAISPITHVLTDPEMEKRRLEGIRRVTQTVEYAQKISEAGVKAWAVEGRREARMGAGNPFAKGVIIDTVTYGSVKDAVKAVGISEKTIRKRANSSEYPNYVWA